MSGAATVHEWAEAVARLADEWPSRGAAVAAARIEDYVSADTGGDGKLSRHKSGSAEVAIEGGDIGADGSMAVWSILEYGTSDHVTHARPGSFLSTPAGPRRFVRVSGVHARETWSRGAAAAMIEAGRDADTAWSEAFS